MILLLSALASLTPYSAAAQDVASIEVRRSEIIRHVLEYGEKRFGPRSGAMASEPGAASGENLVWDAAGQPSYAEGSLEYAAALLMSDGSVERAAAIIDTVLAAQSSGRGKSAGAFPWRPGAKPDPDATAYLAPWLAYIHLRLADRLPAETRTRLARSLQPALAAVGRVKAKPDDTQRYLVKVAARAMLASATDGSVGGKAASDFSAWLKFTSQSGLPVLQNPTATVVATAALHWIWLAAPSEEAKSGAASALEYLYRDIALRYHPGAAMVAGAAVSAHVGDYALGTGATRYLLYGQFGRPELISAEPFAMFLGVPGFSPDEETVAVSRALDEPRTVRARAGERLMTTYLHPDFALATMSGPMERGAAPVVLTYSPAGKPGAYCAVRPLPARAAAVQYAGKAIINFDFDEIGYDVGRIKVEATFHLGPRSALDSVLINESPYTADYPAAVETKASVITERDGVYTAITPIVLGPAMEKMWDAPIRPPELAWVGAEGDEDPELVLRMVARSDRARQLDRDNYRIALAVEMASRRQYASVNDFAAAIYKTRVSRDTKARRVKVGEKVERPHVMAVPRRPVEKAKWIFETRVVQDLVYRSGDDSLVLTEDLQQNQIIAQTVNGTGTLWDFLYLSPSLNHMPGDTLDSVLRPPPPPPEPEEEPAEEEAAEEETE